MADAALSNSVTNMLVESPKPISGKIKRSSLADKEYRYHCMVTFCRCRFKTKEDVRYHEKCHNVEGKNFKCPLCSSVHGCWNDMKCHLWKGHSIDIDLITCEICGYKTDCVNKIDSHKLCHGTERGFSCVKCGKSFKQSGSLRNHMLCHIARQDKTAKHSAECEICHLFFLNRAVVRKHKFEEHKEIECYSCDECIYTTESRHQYQRHLMKHIEKIYECDQCDFKTKRSNILKEHLMTHTGEKPYHCHLCSYATIRLHHFKLHLKKHHPENAGLFECSVCVFTTLNGEKLLKHMNKHKGDEPNSQESIKNINTSVELSTQLDEGKDTGLESVNKRTKQVIKFVCNHCKFETKRKDSFKSHMIIHTGQKPYKCLYCNYTAIQASHYKLHIVRIHPNKSALLKCGYCIFTTYKFDTYEKHMQSHLRGGKGVISASLKGQNKELVVEIPNSSYILNTEIENNPSLTRVECDSGSISPPNEPLKKPKSPTKNKQYKCPYCSFSAQRIFNYISHLKKQHPEKNGLLKCTYCIFESLNVLKFIKHQNFHTKYNNTQVNCSKEHNTETNESVEICETVFVECCESSNACPIVGENVETTIIPVDPLLFNLQQTPTNSANSSILLLAIPKIECGNVVTIQQDDDT